MSVTRKVAYAVVLAAIAIALSPLSIPIGGAKIYPWQSAVNVIAGVVVGPWYALVVALVAAITRNAIGTGTLFAFPGSIIGAVLAGLIYKYTRNVYLAALGEIAGTGIIAAVFSTAIWAPAVMSKHMEALALVVPFLAAAIPGAIIGVIGATILGRAGLVSIGRVRKQA
ncbi:MAG: energy coupling factor transporter S component ThiW [Chloroflexi bacterium]|nr:energy coupling factor transporter S component ThiW [Chloroflexota bacterium]MCL5274507.1 energy coupling factor transporter S component ThiW [Chloroflexota bacterium]